MLLTCCNLQQNLYLYRFVLNQIFVAPAGTNFLIRANAFQECGWSPTWTLTEDFALGMELKKRRWQCRYMREFLAVGEAPDQVRNCFQQKSRWCKVGRPSPERQSHITLCFECMLHWTGHLLSAASLTGGT